MSLFRVTCRGFTSPYPAGVSEPGGQHKTHYVVAADAGEAYTRVLAFIESKDIGFASDRALEKVELIAGPPPSPACGTLLHF